MIENRFIHIKEKETFDGLKENIQDESIVFCAESGEIVTHKESYGKGKWNVPKYPTKYTIQFIFNQTGEGEAITPIYDTGLLDWLVKNIKCYHGKYQEDDSMLVTPLNTQIGAAFTKYNITPVSYLDGSLIASTNNQTTEDFFSKIPTIYYKSEEIEQDKFLITFSRYSFPDCHQVFGEDTLIGYGSGTVRNSKFYSNS